MKRQTAGSFGERAALQYLTAQGYRLVAANWRAKVGEVDLIMQDGPTRVFVEVRLRRPTFFGEGLDTVASQKQQKLIRTAKLYQQKEDWWGDIRFDVVSITHEAGIEPAIEHIKDAFMA